MITVRSSYDQLTGATAYDRDGDKIGKIGQVYYDDATDQPTWITVQHRSVRHERELRAGAGCRSSAATGSPSPTTRPR